MINYHSKSFLMPQCEDGQELHQSVLAVLSNAQHFDKNECKMSYRVTRDHKISPMQLVEVRGTAIPSQCEPECSDITFNQDDLLNIEFNISLSASTQIMVDGKSKNIDSYAGLDDAEAFLKHKFSKSGLEIIKLNIESAIYRVNVSKPKNKFFVPAANFSATVAVTDPSLAELAYVNGIGKHKSYGFGMIKLVSRL